MRHAIRRSAAAMLLMLPTCAAVLAAESAVDHYRKAVAAYKAGDFEGYRASIAEAVRLAPDHPAYVFDLAGADALTGRPVESIAALRRLVEMKVWQDVEVEHDLDPIRGTPEFRDVAADLAALKRPIGTSVKAFRLRERDFIPEGIAYDPDTRSFFVGSVHLGRIVRVDRKGRETGFTRDGEAGVWSILGMAVDTPRKLLWACTSGMAETANLAAPDKGRASLLKLDLATGKLLARYPLAGGQPEHNCNDLAIGPKGDVYVSDAISGQILRLAPGGAGLTEFVPAGRLRSPQGLAFSADGRYLFVADYASGLHRLAPPDAEPLRLEQPAGMSGRGIDGLLFFEGSLIAIQNGVRPHRVVRLHLDAGMARIERAEILEMNNPHFDEPTLGVIVGRDFFYVANSQWSRFEPDGTIFPMDRLERPVVLKLRLD